MSGWSGLGSPWDTGCSVPARGDTVGTRLKIERTGSGLAIEGEMDLATVEEVAAALEDLIQSEGDIMLDVAGLTFIDSTGLRALLEAIERMGQGRRLILQNTQPQVRRVFDIAGVLGKAEGLVVEGLEQPEDA